MCNYQDVVREEMLNLLLVGRIKEEDRKELQEEIQAMAEVEARQLMLVYGVENKLAHIEMSAKVEILLELQEKKARQEWDQLVAAHQDKSFTDPDFLPNRKCSLSLSLSLSLSFI